jgi:CubicO group peptidase (beta-lactamase class C family)
MVLYGRSELLTALSVLLLAGTAPEAAIAGDSATAARPADLEAQADALLAEVYPADGPGGAVIVTRRGRVVYAAGRGLADIQGKRRITPDTPFQLGSITKQFTAAMVLQLVAEGKISLEDPISRFFPGFPEPSARATVRQLLNHTSGIQDYSKIPGWLVREGARPHSTAELVAEVRNRPGKAEPGRSWEYNNAGYMMLGAIVEQATGKSWYEAVSDRIARPLGLTTVRYGASAEAERAKARGYALRDGRQVPAAGAHPSLAHAAGGLTASVRDLAKWAQALHHGKVVGPASYREMTSPARLADGSARPYGFGLRLQTFLGRPAFVHGGAARGVDTDSLYIPSEDLYVAVLANTEDAPMDSSTVSRRIAAVALGDPIPTFRRADVPLASIEPLFGAYQAEGAPPLSFFSRNGKFYLASGEQELEAIPAGGDRFYFGPDRLMWIRFLRGPDGASILEMHEPERARPERAVRTGAVPPPILVPAAVLQSYVGTYQTETVAVTVALAEGGGLTIQANDGPVMPMRPVSQTEFRVDTARLRLVFNPENGKVNRLTLYRGARELHGQRAAR